MLAKLSLLLTLLAATPALADDQSLSPPGGPVDADDAPAQPGAQPMQRGQRGQKRMKRMRKLARVLRRFDTNHDGTVGPDEIPAKVAQRLRRLDRNGDGWIDRSDFKGKRR